MQCFLLRERGVGLSDLQAMLDHMAIELVFTAHPTEAKRRAVREMIEALRAVGGHTAVERIRWQPDERIRAIVRTWPARFETRRADAMGFVRDADFVEVVRTYARTHGVMAPGSGAAM